MPAHHTSLAQETICLAFRNHWPRLQKSWRPLALVWAAAVSACVVDGRRRQKQARRQSSHTGRRSGRRRTSRCDRELISCSSRGSMPAVLHARRAPKAAAAAIRARTGQIPPRRAWPCANLRPRWVASQPNHSISRHFCEERRLVVILLDRRPRGGRTAPSSARGQENLRREGETPHNRPRKTPPTPGRAKRHLSARCRERAGQPNQDLKRCGAILCEHCQGQPDPNRQASGRSTERQAPAAEQVQEQRGQIMS